MFRIVDRWGKEVDFILKPQQLVLDEQMGRRNIIPKGRQGAGISSYVIGRYVAKCLGEENRRCVIVSSEADATARLLGRARFILQHLKGGLQPILGTDSVKAITFPKTGSSLWIGTAGSRKFGRGDTITDLHLSEAAMYDDAEGLWQGLSPAAEHGEITIESTGHGTGNWYHRQCVRAREGRGFKLFFFPSHEMADNRIPFTSEAERQRFARSLREDLEEPELWHKRRLPLEFLQWRRERIEIDFEGDLRAFKQEHPTTFEECFQSSGWNFFRTVRWEPTDDWTRQSLDLHVLQPHPKPGLNYVIGGDVGGGVGRDNSVAQVLCADTGEQVAEWASGYREPHEFGSVLDELGRRFNMAYINVERNNHGLTTLKRLTELYPLHLVHRNTHGGPANQEILSRLSHYGTNVDAGNRGLILATCRSMVAQYPIHSSLLYGELQTFAEQTNGRVEANAGCLDDRVMAYAHAATAMERAQLLGSGSNQVGDEELNDPFGWDAIFGEGRDRARERGYLPIAMERYG